MADMTERERRRAARARLERVFGADRTDADLVDRTLASLRRTVEERGALDPDDADALALEHLGQMREARRVDARQQVGG